jgi:hypothetical protein
LCAIIENATAPTSKIIGNRQIQKIFAREAFGSSKVFSHHSGHTEVLAPKYVNLNRDEVDRNKFTFPLTEHAARKILDDPEK